MPSRDPLGDHLDYVAGLESSLREERQKTAKLTAALSALYDEQNDAPLERRRQEWTEAMGLAAAALRSTSALASTAKQEPKPANLPTIGQTFCGPSPETTAKAIEVSHTKKPRTCGECKHHRRITLRCGLVVGEYLYSQDTPAEDCWAFQPSADAQEVQS